ncbi:uncharacterized protein LOC123527448 [Mercenaria mercenaria]|uniref:uncharacterized protein LOC123527448 n=1 Tax=Mercenaria mercenaria TaxID=6596 RepID=UPI00234F9AE8|nr:uncharacterized protein LOC123527448 [Mercenaria mercenaria]
MCIGTTLTSVLFNQEIIHILYLDNHVIYLNIIMVQGACLLAGFITISACIKHVSADRNETHNNEEKILILGAGISGISAAKTLHDQGYTNIEVLEGSNRVGGRVKSVNLSGYAVELGAQWIYGAGSNPMVKLASEYNLDFKLGLDTWTLRDDLGNDLTENGYEEYKKLVQALGDLHVFSTEMRNNGTSDMTAEALLRFCGWSPDSVVADAVEAAFIDAEFGRESPSISGKYMNHHNVFREHGDDSWFIVNDTRGYEYIVEKLKDSFLPKDDKRMVFNKKVTHIENWDVKDSMVKVYTDDGTLFEADYVIVTFSLGVLQSRNVTFSPPLPDWKLVAIDKFGVGLYMLMYFKFSTSFWDNTTWIVHVTERHGEYFGWFNMNYIFPGCNILQLQLAGAEAKAADRMEDSKLTTKAMEVLRAMYPLANVSEPENFITSRWMSDPLDFGAFSYWTPSFTLKDMDDLGQRIGNLYFAGEYINKTNHGYVHSAYTSGISAALELMACIEDNSLCQDREITKEAENKCTVNDGNGMTQYLYRVFVLVIIAVQMKIIML